jgi:hypothetical protein
MPRQVLRSLDDSQGSNRYCQGVAIRLVDSASFHINIRLRSKRSFGLKPEIIHAAQAG